MLDEDAAWKPEAALLSTDFQDEGHGPLALLQGAADLVFQSLVQVDDPAVGLLDLGDKILGLQGQSEKEEQNEKGKEAKPVAHSAHSPSEQHG
jgi:hypothetical protein